MKMMDQGKSLKEMRAQIEKTYSKYGPPTQHLRFRNRSYSLLSSSKDGPIFQDDQGRCENMALYPFEKLPLAYFLFFPPTRQLNQFRSNFPSEVMALTKLNWNSCSFGSSDPIPILFARTVGRILAELPPGITPQTKYRFYM
jgi:hypothetical protein